MNGTSTYNLEPRESDNPLIFKPIVMSNEQQQQQQHQPQDHGRSGNQLQAPPYNPLLGHSSNPAQLSLGNSVTPDLMKVYESLTQSSTPQTMDAAAAQAPVSHGESAQGHLTQQLPYSTQYQQQQPLTQGQPFGYSNQQYFIPPNQDAGAILSQSTARQGITEKAPETTYSGSGRSLRKRSMDPEDDRSSSEGSNSRARKKGGSDGRWSKRFSWPDELHRDFVSAVFDVGLKHSSPSAILSQMPKYDEISSERIKSHLQKYRIHRSKSKKDFMGAYAASLLKLRVRGDGDLQSLSGGEVAAHLTYSATKEDGADTGSTPTTQATSSASSDPTIQGGTLVLPTLTDAEKQSPIGASMTYMMGLFFSLHQQLMAQREAGVTLGSATVAQNLLPSPEGMQLSGYVPDSINRTENMAGQEHVVVSQQGQSFMNPVSSTRTNLEESHLMKRDMQSSREIQHKMRALKQHELNKVTGSASANPETHQWAPNADVQEGGTTDLEDSKTRGMDDGDEKYQGAGETAEGGSSALGQRDRSRSMSIGQSDEFWVNDEQLFEFLLNP